MDDFIDVGQAQARGGYDVRQSFEGSDGRVRRRGQALVPPMSKPMR
jgi:hypothetical protein